MFTRDVKVIKDIGITSIVILKRVIVGNRLIAIKTIDEDYFRLYASIRFLFYSSYILVI
jgi:hypothetical protein